MKPPSWIQQNWWQAAIVAVAAVFVFVLVSQFLLARQHPTGLVTVYAGPTATATNETVVSVAVDTPVVATDTPAPATDTPQPAPLVNAPHATATPKPPPATAIPPTSIPQYIVTVTVQCATPDQADSCQIPAGTTLSNGSYACTLQSAINAPGSNGSAGAPCKLTQSWQCYNLQGAKPPSSVSLYSFMQVTAPGQQCGP